jgi:Ca-activated chloride channel family protein
MYEKNPARLSSSNGESVPFKGMKLHGKLDGLLFEAEIEQIYVNTSDAHIEVVYTTPLPYAAVLLNIEVRLGDKDLAGVVVGRQKAIVEYEDTISDGNTAIMVERDHGGYYTLNLGNLGPKESCLIRIRYAEVLAFQQRSIRLLIPTVIAPRYGNPLTEGGLSPHQVPETSLDVIYPFEFSIDIHGALAQSRISSPSHNIGVSHRTSETGSGLTISLTTSATLDRDLILNLDQLPSDSFAQIGSDMGNSGGYSSLITLCPRLSNQEFLPLAVKFLVDCSGSMNGDSIQSAKRALHAIVQRLEEGDQFSLSRFGDKIEHRSRALWELKDSTRISALRWIGDLEADMGGTEMEKALKSTFKITDNGCSDVFIITDGEIFGIDSLLETAAKSGQRVFAVGIGSSPTEATIRKLAEISGGACDFVSPEEEVEPAIIRMFARLRSPRLEKLEIIWPEDTQPVSQSTLPLSAFDADTIHLFANWDHLPKGTVTLRGKNHGRDEWVNIASVTLPAANMADECLSRMGAHQRLKHLNKSDAEALAIRYQLITDYTNFLLIHERKEEERAQELPDLVPVRQMLPAGYGGFGSADPTQRPAIARKMAMPNVHYSLQVSSNNMDLEYLDIPAFLRRTSDERKEEDQDFAPSTKLQCDAPISLVDWLLQENRKVWPKTIVELSKLGVMIEVMTWIEIQKEDARWATYSEEELVEAFLIALLQLPVFAMKKGRGGLLNGFMAKVRGLNPSKPAALDFVKHVENELKDLDFDSWGKSINEVFNCMV